MHAKKKISFIGDNNNLVKPTISSMAKAKASGNTISKNYLIVIKYKILVTDLLKKRNTVLNYNVSPMNSERTNRRTLKLNKNNINHNTSYINETPSSAKKSISPFIPKNPLSNMQKNISKKKIPTNQFDIKKIDLNKTANYNLNNTVLFDTNNSIKIKIPKASNNMSLSKTKTNKKVSVLLSKK